MRSTRPLASVLLACLAVAGCGSDTPAPAATVEEKLDFPKDFQFGAAIAGFQVDMGCPTMDPAKCEDRNSDWYAFVTDPASQADDKNFLSKQGVGVGPGHWELYEKDYDLAKDALGSDALRFSFEWSRIFPTATDGVEGYDALKAIADPDALATYHAMLAALKARGLSPLVTLNHYTLPLWIHDALGCHADLAKCSPRGWLDKDRTVKEIAKYAGFCAKEFGGEVDRWATENEPFAVLLSGYIRPSVDRSNPPAVSLKFAEAKQVMVALIEGHARMYDAVKANDAVDADGNGKPSEVGVVYPMVPFAPKDAAREIDVAGAKNGFYLWNMVYLNAVVKGDLDADLSGKAVHRDDLANRMDYLGINYYTRAHVTGTTTAFLPDLSPLSTFNPLTIEVWEDYPRGLYEMAMLVRDEYPGLPIIVTENGAADPADDGTGPSYMVRHLAWLSRAIHDGADVRGYFWWTLMDNYEWNHGMDIRMGLYAVDKDDPAKARKPRASVATFAEITKAHAVTPELAAKYPAPR